MKSLNVRALRIFPLYFAQSGRQILEPIAMNEPSIFLSFIREDQEWARRIAAHLTKAGLNYLDPTSLNTGEDWTEWTRKAAQTATHTLVLVGPQTRLSKSVDQEIELSTQSRENGLGAALIGVILPHHEDFGQPYYEPENVPLRLHDLIQSGYALLRKWSDEPEVIRDWLAEAGQRRQHRRPEPSLRAAAQIYRHIWDAAVDIGGKLDSTL